MSSIKYTAGRPAWTQRYLAWPLEAAAFIVVLALLATGVAHLTVLATPRPRMFFSWIIGLATVAGVAMPFAFGETTESQVATACINLALGICVHSLLRAVMARTVVLGPTFAR